MHLILSKINGKFWNISITKLKKKLLCLGMIIQMLELPCLLILRALEIGHASYLVCKGT